MEESTEQRKARLAALKRAKDSSANQESQTPTPVLNEKRKIESEGLEQEEEFVRDEQGNEILDVENLADSELNAEESMKLRFRNYRPKDTDDVMKVSKLVDKAVPSNIDDAIAEILELAKRNSSDPILNIAPKKPNWDLKRDVAEKMAQLQKSTKRALNAMIVEKIRLENENEQ